MAHTRSNKCPRCGCSYGSATHAKKCRGLSGQSLRSWRGARNASRRNSRGMAKATQFAFASSPASPAIPVPLRGSGGGIVDASFYEDAARRKAQADQRPEVQS